MKKIFYLISAIILIIVGGLIIKNLYQDAGNTVSGTTESETIIVSTRPSSIIK